MFKLPLLTRKQHESLTLSLTQKIAEQSREISNLELRIIALQQKLDLAEEEKAMDSASLKVLRAKLRELGEK